MVLYVGYTQMLRRSVCKRRDSEINNAYYHWCFLLLKLQFGLENEPRPKRDEFQNAQC